jgi:hypothetical protein
MTYRDSIFSAYLRGAARSFDLFGGINHERDVLKNDEEAIREDWRAVGKDLNTSLDSYGRSSAKQPAC